MEGRGRRRCFLSKRSIGISGARDQKRMGKIQDYDERGYVEEEKHVEEEVGSPHVIIKMVQREEVAG